MRSFLCCGLLFALGAGVGAVDIPLKVNFQGKLLDGNSVPRNGNFTMTFRLYDAFTGGTPLYTEGPLTVPVVNGVFAVQLGTQTALSADLFSGTSAYLGITVSPDSEMVPRQQLVMNAYAFTSAQLVQQGNIRVNAGPNYSTFTVTGDLLVPYGLVAGTGAFSGALTASSGTFKASGIAQYSLATASGINVQAGTLYVADNVTAGKFIGNGKDLTNVVASVSGPITVDSVTVKLGGAGIYSLNAASGVYVASGTLLVHGGGGVVADYGVVASTGLFTGSGLTQYSLMTSSGLFIASGSLRVQGGGGIYNSYGIVTTTLTASSATFTDTSNYSIFSSSGIQILAGTLRVQGAGGIYNNYGIVTTTLTVSSATFTDISTYSIRSTSGIFVAGGSLRVDGGGGIHAKYGIVATTVTASSATFTDTSNYSIFSSSGIQILAGTLRVQGAGGIYNNYGIVTTTLTASSATFTDVSTFSIRSASGIWIMNGTLDVDGGGGIVNKYGIVTTTLTATSIRASSATFIENSTYSVTTASGIYMTDGTLMLGPNAGTWGIVANVAQSSGSVSTSIAAETVLVSTGIFITGPKKGAFIMGSVVITRGAATTCVCYVRIRYNTAGACTTASTLLYASGASVNSTAGISVGVPILATHFPGITGNVNYCLTGGICVGGIAHTASNYSLAVLETK